MISFWREAAVVKIGAKFQYGGKADFTQQITIEPDPDAMMFVPSFFGHRMIRSNQHKWCQSSGSDIRRSLRLQQLERYRAALCTRSKPSGWQCDPTRSFLQWSLNSLLSSYSSAWPM